MRIASDIFTIKKITLARSFLYVGMLTAYWGALMPWFIWKLSGVYFVISAAFIGASMVLSGTLQDGQMFTRSHFQQPVVAFIALSVVMRLVNGNNVNSYIALSFYVIIFFSLFVLRLEELVRLMRFLCVTMAALLSVSIPFFFLYLLGFPLPSSPIMNEELMYSFTNFYFFLVDDRSFFFIFPRFHSVFMEPGHLGTASVLLLMTQIGKWKKWYNVVLLVATVLTFSLAAFVLLTLIAFAGVWVNRKRILPKILLLVAFFAIVVVGAIFYNDGDNLLNNLIVERLAIDDGKLAGDNRVTDAFQLEYDDFAASGDILFGREYNMDDFGFGNAGYRVFIYDYGLVSLLLVMVFYACAVFSSKERRAVIAMFVIGVAAFWVRAIPLSFYFFIPMYAFAHLGTSYNKPHGISPNGDDHEQTENITNLTC